MSTRAPALPAWKRALLDAGLFYAALVWGATFFMVKDALREIGPLTLVGYRFLVSAAFLLPFLPRGWRRGDCLREGLVLGALLMLLYVTQTAGLQYTSASNSGFITGLFVFFVPLFLLVFLGQPPQPAQWGAVALALAGLWLLTGGIGRANKGDLLTIVSAVSYAAHVLATDRYVRGETSPVLLAFHQFWFSGLSALCLAWAVGEPLQTVSPRGAAVILFLALFANVSAFYIQMVAQRHTPPLKVSLIFSLEPVFAAVFAWTLGGEAFAARQAAGGGLILAGMVLGELTRLKPPPQQEVLPV